MSVKRVDFIAHAFIEEDDVRPGMPLEEQVAALPRTWDDSVTLPWGNQNQRPRTRYLIDLRPGPGVSGGTVTRAALNAREARGIVVGEYPAWQIGCVRPMFTKGEQ